MSSAPDIREARRLFPATAGVAYLNTAAVGLASRTLIEAYRDFIGGWTHSALDYARGEAAGEHARTTVARLIGADRDDVALIPSVSAAAGLVASQFGPAGRGENVVIGEREYSSNHFPWRLLAAKGYDVRQVAFRNGGLQPDDIERRVDRRTVLVAFSGVQTATGHRSDIGAISAVARAAGAIVFVDGSQLVGAVAVADELAAIDVLATSDHKFLLNAGRGVGYCYFSPAVQARFVPTAAGWKAGRVPFDSFFGPTMDLSATASRFDSSISWLAAVGDEAALSVFELFGADSVYARNRELASRLAAALEVPDSGSTILSVPLADADPARTVAALKERGVVCSARDGNLRFAIHFYNHEDDLDRAVSALASARGR